MKFSTWYGIVIGFGMIAQWALVAMFAFLLCGATVAVMLLLKNKLS